MNSFFLFFFSSELIVHRILIVSIVVIYLVFNYFGTSITGRLIGGRLIEVQLYVRYLLKTSMKQRRTKFKPRIKMNHKTGL